MPGLAPQMRFGSGVAVAQAGGCSSDGTPNLGTSRCRGFSPKKQKKRERNRNVAGPPVGRGSEAGRLRHWKLEARTAQLDSGLRLCGRTAGRGSLAEEPSSQRAEAQPGCFSLLPVNVAPGGREGRAEGAADARRPRPGRPAEGLTSRGSLSGPRRGEPAGLLPTAPQDGRVRGAAPTGAFEPLQPRPGTEEGSPQKGLEERRVSGEMPRGTPTALESFVPSGTLAACAEGRRRRRWTRALWAGKPGCSAAQGLAAFLQTEGIRRGVGGVHPEDRARGPRRQPRPGLVEAALLGRDLARLVLPPPQPGGSICNWQPAPALPGLDAGNFRLQRSRAGGQACCAVGWIEFQVSL